MDARNIFNGLFPFSKIARLFLEKCAVLKIEDVKTDEIKTDEIPQVLIRRCDDWG